LARTHALMAAGDTMVAVALADSLFFDIDPKSARWKVALFLVLTVAPFSIVAPLIGPALDRMMGGRRLMVILVGLGRATIAGLMVVHLRSLLLFPEAFVSLVLSKAYAVSKSALVPTVVSSEHELVEANSKLGLISGVCGFAAAIPAILFKLIGSEVTVAFAAVVFLAAAISGVALPREVVAAASAGRQERAELRSGGIVLAASAMAMIRGVVGFLFFHVAFWFRHEKTATAWFALVLVCSALGTLAGNGISPVIRRRVREEVMFVGALTLTAMTGVLAAFTGGRATAALLSGAVGFSAAMARLAFDAIVQRDAPDANRGRAFAQFETRFQLAWVIAAFIPVVIPFPGWAGFLVVGLMGAFAAVSYVLGSRHLRTQGRLPDSLTGRARRELVRRRAAAQRAARTASRRNAPAGRTSTTKRSDDPWPPPPQG
jgi:Major Facilitator Superfamily